MADRSQPDPGCEQAAGDKKIPAVGLQRRPTNRVEDGLRSPAAPALGFRARPNRKDSLEVISELLDSRRTMPIVPRWHSHSSCIYCLVTSDRSFASMVMDRAEMEQEG